MTNAARTHYLRAIELRDRIASGQSNEPTVMAWAAVCRECAKANNAKRQELDGRAAYTRLELGFFNNLNRVWWPAKAQVETLARMAA